MKGSMHAARAAQVQRSVARLDAGDYEMRIEAAMLAGTHLLNVCLHKLGITADTEDVMHAEYLGGPSLIKAELMAPDLVGLLLQIEMLRPGYVRGDFEGGVQAGHKAMQLLDALQVRALAIDPTLERVAPPFTGVVMNETE